MPRSQFAIQAGAERAADVFPRRIEIDNTMLELYPGGRTRHGEAKFRALWSNGRLSGDGRVELKPASKATSLLVVSLQTPTRFGRIFRPRVLKKMIEQFGLALVYEIETRSAEETDPFIARRTTAELVRQRSASQTPSPQREEKAPVTRGPSRI
jgi:hypothetical protein